MIVTSNDFPSSGWCRAPPLAGFCIFLGFAYPLVRGKARHSAARFSTLARNLIRVEHIKSELEKSLGGCVELERKASWRDVRASAECPQIADVRGQR